VRQTLETASSSPSLLRPPRRSWGCASVGWCAGRVSPGDALIEYVVLLPPLGAQHRIGIGVAALWRASLGCLRYHLAHRGSDSSAALPATRCARFSGSLVQVHPELEESARICGPRSGTRAVPHHAAAGST